MSTTNKRVLLAGTCKQNYMNPWLVNPSWQNFSSLYRDAVTAQVAKTGMERSHHLTASLYFGISTLEAFLNRKMRAHQQSTKTEQDTRRGAQGVLRDQESNVTFENAQWGYFARTRLMRFAALSASYGLRRASVGIHLQGA